MVDVTVRELPVADNSALSDGVGVGGGVMVAESEMLVDLDLDFECDSDGVNDRDGVTDLETNVVSDIEVEMETCHEMVILGVPLSLSDPLDEPKLETESVIDWLVKRVTVPLREA